MKTMVKFILGIVVAYILITLANWAFVSLSFSKVSSSEFVDWKKVEILEEPTDNYVGSYYLYRGNSPEWGEYTSIEVFFGFITKTKICLGSDTQGYFFKKDGYSWERVEGHCLQLKKE